MITLTLEQVAKLLNNSATEAKTRFEKDGQLIENAGSSLVEALLKRRETRHSEQEKARTDQFKKGQKEAYTAIDKILNSSGISEYDNTLAGVQLLADSKKADPVKVEGGDKLTLEQIQAWEGFAALRDDLQNPLKEDIQTLQKEYDDYKLSNTLNEYENILSKHFTSYLDGKKAIYANSNDAEEIERGKKKRIAKEIEFLKLKGLDKTIGIKEVEIDGVPMKVPFPIGTDGKPLRDKRGDEISIEKFYENMWAYGFHQIDPAQAGGKPKPGGGSGGTTDLKFNSEKEFQNYLNTEGRTVAEKAKAKRAYSESLQKKSE